jgi:hypothetical protein
MTKSQYRQMVSVDVLPIRQDDLGNENSQVGYLYGKYLNFYSDEKTKLKALERAFKILWHQKTLYYLGKADPEVYKEKPFDLKVRPIKNELQQYLEADPEIQAAQAALDEQDILVDYLHDVLKGITDRGFRLKQMMDWLWFTNPNGGGSISSSRR